MGADRMSLPRTLRFHVAYAGIALALSLLVVSVALSEEQATMEQVLGSMRDFKQRFVANEEWLLEYNHNREYHELPPGFQPNMSRTKVINACKGDRWYLSHVIETKERPIRVEASWTDGVCAHRVGGALAILPDVHPNIFERCYYTNTLFLNIHSKTKFNTDILTRVFAASPNAAFPNGLPDSVEGRLSEYKMTSSEESIDGDSCVVLTRDNRDIMWIDRRHGGICRRRIEYFPSGGIAVEYKNEQLRHYLEGLWLPQHQEVIRYNGDDAPDRMRGKIRYIEKNDLLRIQFGNVPDALFNIKPPYPGFVNDHVRGVTYKTQPRNAEAGDVLAKAALEARTISGSRPIGRTSLAIVANVCVIAALVLAFQIRRVRRRAR
jgi:hypothetical protein